MIVLFIAIRESPQFLLRVARGYFSATSMDNAAMKRKKQLPEFRELFKALFNIPDRDIQIRVLDAVNGIIKDTCDCLCCKKELVEMGTQTEFVPGDPFPIKRVHPADSPVNSDSNGGPEIKRRKRNRKVPRVEKSTNEPEPFLAKPETPSPVKQILVQTDLEADKWNLDELGTISEPHDPVTNNTELVEYMRKEFRLSGIFKNGLRPIHKAIKGNNVNYLKLQLWVLKYKHEDINDVLTEDGETLLEFAVKFDCTTEIVQELVDLKLALDGVDDEGNTILHLAMMYTENTNMLHCLLEGISRLSDEKKQQRLDFDFLTKRNNNGLTALHIGVKKEKFLLCKTLLEFVDEKLKVHTVGKKVVMLPDLMKTYLGELNGFTTKEPVQVNRRKMELINAVDIMHGRTPLFFAVTQNSKLMIYMLLCHLASPLICEHSRMDCLNYVETVDNISPQIQSALRNAATYLEKCI